jgi:predicted glycosyltransferase
MSRVLMYSQDGQGLGHLRRSFNIANEIRLRDPHCNILIVADSPAVSILGVRHGIEILKLPTIVKTGRASWRNGTLSLAVGGLVRLRSQLLLHTLREFRPETVLIDHMPVGAMGELKPMLDYASSQRRAPKVFLGLRDVIDKPEVVRAAWEQLGAYEYLGAYEAVLVYGDRAVYDATEAYALASHAREVVYCNYVSPRRVATGSGSTRRRPLVLMMGGGGSDAFPLAKAFLEAMPELRSDLDIDAMLLTGPNMARAERERLRRSRGVQIHSSHDDATKLIRQASVIVTMAGYNSLCEVLAWQRKALVVPRRGPSAEQQIRSSLFSERSLIRRLSPRELTAARLRERLRQLLTDDEIPDVAGIPALNGASLAADLLTEWTPSSAASRNGSRADVVAAKGSPANAVPAPVQIPPLTVGTPA